MKYIASCSFGKDSLATVLLALLKGEPLDRVVYSEVMFDKENDKSGELPEHRDFIYNKAIPKLESMGCKIDVVRADRDYVSYFYKVQRQEGSPYNGMYYGFPLGGRCVINKELKTEPIHKYYKQFDDDITQYVGIAIDEKDRLDKIHKSKYKISLLEKYGYTEKMAYDLCKQYDLLSPIYKVSKRNGCWFCPEARIVQYCYVRKNHPDLWDKLRELSKLPNLCSYGFKYGKTLQEIEKKMDAIDYVNEHQLKLF